MKKSKILTLLAMLLTILFVDIQVLLASQLSLFVKLLIIGVTSIGQLVAILAVMEHKPKPKSQQGKWLFGLTQKLYGLLVFSATSVYTIGIWLITPEAAGFSKPVILGLGLAIQLNLLIYFAFKKVGEEPDERFYANLAKSASVMCALYMLGLLLLGGFVAYFGAFPLHAGLLFITVGASILLFGIIYLIFENRG